MKKALIALALTGGLFLGSAQTNKVEAFPFGSRTKVEGCTIITRTTFLGIGIGPRHYDTITGGAGCE